MERLRLWIVKLAGLTMIWAAWVAPCATAERVALVVDGIPQCSIIVGVEADFSEQDKFNWNPDGTLLHWAAEDLATYLGRMSGATIEVGREPIAGLTPIYVGSFLPVPPLKAKTEFGDAYSVDATTERIVLHGESRRAVYYAAAHLLGDLGVRWYAPGELGEVMPQRKSIDIAAGRIESAPKFITRRIMCFGDEQTRWMYRNRLGEPMIPSGHSAHAYARTIPGWLKKAEGRAQNLGYYALVDGKPGHMNLSHPDVVKHFAANVAKTLQAGPRKQPGGKVAHGSVSVSPDGGSVIDERPETRAADGGAIDPILRQPSFSHAWFGFLNRVCEEIERRSPDLEFTLGSLATLNYTQPPTKLRLDPRIIPVVAPAAFNRFTSIGKPGAPTSAELEAVLRGWTALSPRVGVYLVNFIPGEMALPYTRRLHWTNDLPNLYSLGIRDVTVESQPNWHTMVPGNFVAAQLLWDPATDVERLLAEFYPAYYGSAAAAMRRYDTALEEAYESARTFVGGVWALHTVLSPDVLDELEKHLTSAEAAVRATTMYRERVEITRFSLTFARRYFAARDALNRFDLAEAERHSEAFLDHYRRASTKYPLFFGPNEPWVANIERFYETFHRRTFSEAGRIAREATIVYRFPDEWTARLTPIDGGNRPTLDRPTDDDVTPWKPLKTFSATLAEQGRTTFRGIVQYRHEFELAPDAIGAGPLKLTFFGVDGRTRVFWNNRDLGEKYVASFGMHELDVTEVAGPGKNQVLVVVDNTFPNAVGTGGIMRPVLLYAPQKPLRTDGQPAN